MLLKKMHIIDVYLSKIKNIEDKLPDITKLATKMPFHAKINEIKGDIPKITKLATYAALNAKINQTKGEIPNITSMATTSSRTAVENRMPSVRIQLKKLAITQKLMTLKRKLLIISMINILILQNLKLTSEKFAARLKQANLTSKNDMLIS